jgi:hypothetical protein
MYLPAVICAGFALRLLVALKAQCIEMDGIGYATIADQFGKGLFRAGLNNVFSPMYPFFVSLLHLAVPDVELAGRLVSVFFGVLLIWISFLFASRLLCDSAKAVWVAVLVAFHPYLVRYSGQVLSESLAAFLFTLTVFSFYAGWQDRRRAALVVSGVCLLLTYLTRPEYLVFYAPFLLLLLRRRRVADCAVLLLPFLVLGALYISYLHAQTGKWMVSNRATLLPFVPVSASFANIPFVSYDFMIAVFPLFLLFAILGLPRAPRPYRLLALVLVVFHILSLSFISHSTKRYSVEFVPISMIFAAVGIYGVGEYFRRFFPGRATAISCVLAAAVVFMGVLEPLAPPHYERGLYKQAGLFLLTHDPGSVVAARLPLAAFYAQGKPVDLLSELSTDKGIAGLDRVLADKRVGYLVVDEELEKEVPCLREYLSGKMPVCTLSHKEAFLRVYKFS